MNNISLIGMPGAGKSTIGVLLAKKIGYGFEDTDIAIQQRMGTTLSELMTDIGQTALMQVESEVIAELELKRRVIATGGSAVFGKKGMAHLQSIGRIIYLKVDLSEIQSRVGDLVARGVVMHGCKTLEELYHQRVPLYESYADLTIDCNQKTAEQIADEICRLLQEELQ